MASIRITIPVDRPAAVVWSAVADVGEVHERLARGFVVDTQLHDGERVVTFARRACSARSEARSDRGRRQARRQAGVLLRNPDGAS